MGPKEKPKSENGDADLAEALLDELGDDTPSDALIYDEAGNPISPAAKQRG